MREKLVAIVFALIILSASLPIVASTQSIKSVTPEATLQTGKPDLVGDVEVVEMAGFYVFKHIITNIGDAPTEYWSINTTVYDFGGYLLYKMGFDPAHIYYHYLFAYLLAWLGHINLVRILNTRCWSTENYTRQLSPGENYSWYSFPLPNQDYFINAQIGLVVECIVDEYNWANESNENNNCKVLRWWRPYETDPPF